MIACLGVFWGYWRGGRRRAQKYAAYYSLLSVFLFIFQLVMWIVAAAIFEHSKATGDDKDLWGWACVHNEREQLFKDQIDYALLCRLQVSQLSSQYLLHTNEHLTGLGVGLCRH